MTSHSASWKSSLVKGLPMRKRAPLAVARLRMAGLTSVVTKPKGVWLSASRSFESI